MRLHNGIFLIRQLPRFIQDLRRNRNLPDVVQRRSRADHRNLFMGKLVFIRHLSQTPEQELCNCMNIAGMQSAFTIPKFHNMAQYVDHQAALLLLLQDLIRYQPHETLLLCVEQYGVDDPSMHDQIIKRTTDIIRDARLIRTFQICGGTFRRNDDDRNVIDPMILVHHGQYFKAIHLRHYDIKQKQRDLRPHLLKLCHCFFSVFRFQDLVLIFQHILQNSTVHL